MDFNNDGWLDIFVANGHVYPQVDQSDTGTRYRQRPQLFLNQNGKRFAEIGGAAGLRAEGLGRGVAFGDYDNDGDIDILINNQDGPPTLLRNENRTRNHWVQLTADRRWKEPKCHRGAGRNTIRAGNANQRGQEREQLPALQNDLRVHFGLGNHPEISAVGVRWPDGKQERFTGVKADRFWFLKKGSGKAEPLKM